MATIKGYTDMEQSKKLAEILPIETADMWYEDSGIMIPRLGHIPNDYTDTEFPCWSLAALLDVLPKNYGRYTKSLYWFDDAWHLEYIDEDGESCYKGETANNTIDACYEMIIYLHELKMLSL